jgi:signal transduction histidine kinase
MLDGWLLTTELQRSRERVVQAREEERLRLHRDLHDGLGPTLGGLTLGLHAARNVVRTDPARAESVLERLSELASEATGEVRVLVDGLRPVALDALGLVGAIRRHTDLGEAGVAVHVHADDVADLPPAVEVAVLRIVLEAVTNVRRHAHASRCEVRLTRDPGGMLTVVVEDDGRGLDGGNGGAAGGVGLESIRARATELGGAVAFGRSPLGGTRILARIPVASTVPAS